MSNLVSVPKNGSLANNGLNRNFPNVSNWLDDFFNREFPSILTSNVNSGMTLPKVNIKEFSDSYVVEMAAPGLKKTDFQIEIDNQVLVISAELLKEDESENTNYTRREYGYSSFKRTLNLPDTVNDEKINARYLDGILSVVLPKKEEAKLKPTRNIKIS